MKTRQKKKRYINIKFYINIVNEHIRVEKSLGNIYRKFRSVLHDSNTR